MFTIQSITISSFHDNRFATAHVVVTMPAKEFSKTKCKGTLYGIDISNAVSDLSDRLVRAYYPSVDDKQRASKGIKTIKLNYQMTMEEAQRAGLSCFNAGGQLIARYGDSVDLPLERKANLQLVVA